MVIAPLSWWRGEWVDYTFVANLNSCLQQVLNQMQYCQSLKTDLSKENFGTENSKLAGKYNLINLFTFLWYNNSYSEKLKNSQFFRSSR